MLIFALIFSISRGRSNTKDNAYLQQPRKEDASNYIKYIHETSMVISEVENSKHVYPTNDGNKDAISILRAMHSEI